MGPRSLERGRDAGCDGPHHAAHASMGPRSLERGRPLVPPSATAVALRFNGAAFLKAVKFIVKRHIRQEPLVLWTVIIEDVVDETNVLNCFDQHYFLEPYDKPLRFCFTWYSAPEKLTGNALTVAKMGDCRFRRCIRGFRLTRHLACNRPSGPTTHARLHTGQKRSGADSGRSL